MAGSRSRRGSQRLDITTYGRKLVIEEQQLIDYSEDKRKRCHSNATFPAPDTIITRFCLHVGNLPYDVTAHDLRKLFSGYNIADARVPTRRRNDRSRGCGFVDMKSLRDAQNAISSLSGVGFLGRSVTVIMSRDSFKSATVRENRDDEPPEKRVKRGSDWEMDTKISTSLGSRHKDNDILASPPTRKLSIPNADSPSVDIVALEFAHMWVDEYAGPDIGRAKRAECLARLLLQLDVPESKLHEHISRTLMARAASQKHDTSVAAGARSDRMADKLEQQQWDELHARAHLPGGGRAPEISSLPRKSQGESHKTRSFGSVEWMDGRE